MILLNRLPCIKWKQTWHDFGLLRVVILKHLPPTAQALQWISPSQRVLARCCKWVETLMPLEQFQSLITTPMQPNQRRRCFISEEIFCVR